MVVSRLVTLVLFVLGLLGIAAAIIYFAEPAKSIPSVLPGHLAGSTIHRTHRGIAALIIGVGLLVLAAGTAAMTRRRPA